MSFSCESRNMTMRPVCKAKTMFLRNPEIARCWSKYCELFGVFCKAGEKTLHADCFTCSTCGTSLKNIGYNLVNDKLYCELHAKQQRQNQFLELRTINLTFYTSGGTETVISAQNVSGFVTRRGRGILHEFQEGVRIPICESCNQEIRGPFVLALNKAWCPDHFVCSRADCRRKLLDIGFVEEHGRIYCEICFEKYLAPVCSKCHSPIKGDCLTALGQKWHPNCFCCTTCKRSFGNSSFYVEDGLPYCEEDWNAQFTTKCYSCQFPIEVGDRWVEAMGNAYHLDCFKCTVCYKSLEGQSFYSKNGRPYCKAHI
ncbi:unnamed protein product [Soboliphyme baturini]|uniref:LIM domain protein n=1 Tax=Soboliphyme baturini TaxID=241478 RepID=A0A183IG52_9BILA|nr:unnamed protein product [Soboliphyme baturini]